MKHKGLVLCSQELATDTVLSWINPAHILILYNLYHIAKLPSSLGQGHHFLQF